MRLVDHVGRMETLDPAVFGIDQFVEDEEQAIGVDRTRIEIVIAIFGIVEVEAPEFLELDQAGDDYFDIGIGRMVAEID
ncbi:hypothetical protein D3C80_1938910 [compost metagenome]